MSTLCASMILTFQIQLLPDKGQAAKLKSTIERFNQACSWLAKQAFESKTANKIKLQQKFSYDLRQKFDLSAQMAAICIRHVGGTYSRDKSILPVFRPNAAMPYDNRILSFKGVDRVSILTLEGRIKLPFLMGKYQRERFSLAKGQSDLVHRKDGKWFLLVTVDAPEGTPIPPTDFIGVDFGVVNLATDSDGVIYTNAETEKVRQKQNKVRRSLGRKATAVKRSGNRPKNVKRKLKDLSGKERRFKANENHRISKLIVEKATDTKRGIGLEDLTEIRERTRFRPECGHIDKGNRPVRALFLCRSCAHFDHADVVGATNIACAARVAWREVAEQRLKVSRVVQRQAPPTTRFGV